MLSEFKFLFLAITLIALGSLGYSQLAYAGVSATGGVVTTFGDYKIHYFDVDGTFVVTGSGDIEYLIVGDGGAGGIKVDNPNGGGGGGGGGVLLNQTGYPVTTGSYAVVFDDSKTGSHSFDGIEAEIGGKGGNGDQGAPGDGLPGGSGGGCGGVGGFPGIGGLSLPITTPVQQGNAGGGAPGEPACISSNAGGGGGGCGSVGVKNGGASNPGAGGAGCTMDFSGTSLTYAAGSVGKYNGNAGSGVGCPQGVGTDGCIILRYILLSPTPPIELFSDALSETSVKLTWKLPFKDRGNPIVGYKIEIESPKGTGFSVLVANTTNTNLTYTQTTGLISSQEVNYRVSAINVEGAGDPGNESSTDTFGSVTPKRTNPLNLVWTTITNAIALDKNLDGFADQIYSYSNVAQNYTFTRILGDGNNTNSILLESGHTLQNINSYQDQIFVTSATGCNTSLYNYDTTTGVTQTDYVNDTGSGTLAYVIGMPGVNNEGVLHAVCHNTDEYIVKNSTTTILNNISVTTETSYGFNTALSWSDIGGNNAFSSLSEDIGGVGVFPVLTTETETGHCSSTGCIVGVTDASEIKPTTTSGSVGASVAGSIQMYLAGIELPSGDKPITPQSLWDNYLPDVTINRNSLVPALLHFEILDTALTNDPYRFIFEDGFERYLVYVSGNDLIYAPIGNAFLSDRSVAYVIPDADPDTFDAQVPSSVITTRAYTIFTPVTSVSASYQGMISIVSGYPVAIDSGATLRSIDSQGHNDLSIIPWVIGLTTGQTPLSVTVSGAPVYAGIELRHETNLYLTERQYAFDTQVLAADNTLTVDLTTGECVDVFIRDLDTTPVGDYDLVGNLCNSGAMPKSIVFTQNLAFTFWTLPWGVNHVYSQSITEVVTQVRNDNQPFDYTVNLYHANGTLGSTIPYTGTTPSTAFDERSFNTTNMVLPSRLEVLDNNDELIYYATIGFPNYFSGTSAFFLEWFEIDGFNLLYMLPIIFAAMFTRNTVGIGTGLTVALISILAWTGFIVIDEIVVYALIFFAIIGMIAYRQLRS